MTASAGVLIGDEPPLRHCVLNRAERRNALSLALCEAVIDALKDPPRTISMVVIGHSGDTFSSGADLTEIAPALLVAEPEPSRAATLVAIRRLLAAVEGCHIPVIAAVDGRCLAGGLELALACDLIAATGEARFFDAHLAGGLLPSGGASVRLRERVGHSRAFRMLVEGVELGSEEALAWGLADAVFPTREDLLEWARVLALRLAGYPPGLVTRIKGELRAGLQPRDGPGFRSELTDLDSYLEEASDEVRRRLARYTRQDA
jgi:enoyl-CoA hydratase/carnithine racemase